MSSEHLLSEKLSKGDRREKKIGDKAKLKWPRATKLTSLIFDRTRPSEVVMHRRAKGWESNTEIRLIPGEKVYPLEKTFKQQRNILKGMRERVT